MGHTTPSLRISFPTRALSGDASVQGTDNAWFYRLYNVYIVRKWKCPVFFIEILVEIKPFPHIDASFTRSKADQQMRDTFESIIGRNLVLPKLYAISAMDTRFSVYEYDKATNTLSSPSIPRHPTFVTDVAPASR